MRRVAPSQTELTHDNGGYVNSGAESGYFPAPSIADSSASAELGVPTASTLAVPGPSSANDGVPVKPRSSASAVVASTRAFTVWLLRARFHLPRSGTPAA